MAKSKGEYTLIGIALVFERNADRGARLLERCHAVIHAESYTHVLT